jgi:hypothetical protein
VPGLPFCGVPEHPVKTTLKKIRRPLKTAEKTRLDIEITLFI